MKEYFSAAEEWSEDKKSYVGFPRPFYRVPKEYQVSPDNKPDYRGKRFLAPIIPVPYQSYPAFVDYEFLGLVEENEDLVISSPVCGYCGESLLVENSLIRWKLQDVIFAAQEDRVASDHLPVHERCMAEARKFCPKMRTLKDHDFEKGSYEELLENSKKENVLKLNEINKKRRGPQAKS
jgi:hypothetical protein